jgi:acylpyruvate hydrolase
VLVIAHDVKFACHRLAAAGAILAAVKLATIRDGDRTRAVRIDGDTAVDIGAADVGELLRNEGWRQRAESASGVTRPVAGLDFAPLIPRPEKIICVGLNYRNHILETGRDIPEYPTLFAKYIPALIGANDEVVLPTVSESVDWEAELAVIIGKRVRHATPESAPDAIAGYACLNDVSVRDWQNRTLEWLQGKTFESTTPLGPYLVTADESPGPAREISCEVDGEVKQKADTSDLVFDPFTLVSYISTVITLEPGDVIATGTPGGVGNARNPKEFLRDGSVMITRIAGLGECHNVCRREMR